MPTALENQDLKLSVERSLDELATQLMVSGPSSIRPDSFEVLCANAEEGGFRAVADAANALAQRLRDDAKGSKEADLEWLRDSIAALGDLMQAPPVPSAQPVQTPTPAASSATTA